jgi:hypothetical protein
MNARTIVWLCLLAFAPIARAQDQRPPTQAAVAAGASVDDTPLPSKPSDPCAARLDELEKGLLDRDAAIVHLKAELATAEANHEQTKRELQSVTLTDDVTKLLARYKAIYGGDWIWDNGKRAIVPVVKEEKK